MKSKKAEIGIGVIIMVAVAIIASLVLFQQSAQNLGVTQDIVTTNTTYTAPAEGVAIDLIGQELLSTPVVYNASSGATIGAGNYTIAEGLNSAGTKIVRYTSSATSSYANYSSIRVYYTYGANGYIEDSGARSIAGLIVVLAALAIMAVALYPSIKNNFGT